MGNLDYLRQLLIQGKFRRVLLVASAQLANSKSALECQRLFAILGEAADALGCRADAYEYFAAGLLAGGNQNDTSAVQIRAGLALTTLRKIAPTPWPHLRVAVDHAVDAVEIKRANFPTERDLARAAVPVLLEAAERGLSLLQALWARNDRNAVKHLLRSQIVYLLSEAALAASTHSGHIAALGRAIEAIEHRPEKRAVIDYKDALIFAHKRLDSRVCEVILGLYSECLNLCGFSTPANHAGRIRQDLIRGQFPAISGTDLRTAAFFHDADEILASVIQSAYHDMPLADARAELGCERRTLRTARNRAFRFFMPCETAWSAPARGKSYRKLKREASFALLSEFDADFASNRSLADFVGISPRKLALLIPGRNRNPE